MKLLHLFSFLTIKTDMETESVAGFFKFNGYLLQISKMFSFREKRGNTSKHLWFYHSIKTVQVITVTNTLKVIKDVTWASFWPTILGLPAEQESRRDLKIRCFGKYNLQILFWKLPLSFSGNSFFFRTLIDCGIKIQRKELKIFLPMWPSK